MTPDKSHETFFDSMKRYVAFGEADAAALRGLRPACEPHFAAIVDAFYDEMLRHPDALAAFTDPTQIARLKRSMHAWLAGVLEGPYDEAYCARRSRIGHAHVR